SLDGFSFCISHILTKEIQNFGSYIFDKTIPTPELLLVEIENILADNKLFSQEFESVTVLHQNTLSTLVPTTLFDENELNTYLEYTIKTLTTDFIAFDSLSQLEVKNVYIPYVNLNNFFFQKFGEFEYKHHATVLIDKLILHTKNNAAKQFFVNVSKHHIDIVVIENSKLLFYNTFSFATKEDFIYYILFTTEQLQLNPEELLVRFMGEIKFDSELYTTAYQYIRNVDFIDIEMPFFDEHPEILNHSHYTTLP
ncbi:MAG: DUF3822 family protein, partial [Polaribacter sp.]|nr:DUF3822 family protein [Polaribacter sp.]